MQRVLDWFWQLSAARGSNGMGLNPITFESLAAWSALSGIKPTPFEVRCIRRIDDAYLAWMSQQNA